MYARAFLKGKVIKYARFICTDSNCLTVKKIPEKCAQFIGDNCIDDSVIQ